MSKATRALVAQAILDASAGAPSPMPDSHALACMAQAERPSRLAQALGPPSGPYAGNLEAPRMGSLEAALAALDAGSSKVGVLVFCSATRLGGGWLAGASAQEESISLCSTWALGQERSDFHHAKRADPFYGDEVLELDGWILAPEPGRWLAQPANAFFVGFCAPNMKALRETGLNPSDPALERRCRDALATRCRAALSSMRRAGCDVAIVGAIGCGVFEVDPRVACAAWRDALESHGAGFSRVEFALGPAPSATITKHFDALAATAPEISTLPRSRGKPY